MPSRYVVYSFYDGLSKIKIHGSPRATSEIDRLVRKHAKKISSVIYLHKEWVWDKDFSNEKRHLIFSIDWPRHHIGISENTVTFYVMKGEEMPNFEEGTKKICDKAIWKGIIVPIPVLKLFKETEYHKIYEVVELKWYQPGYGRYFEN